MIARKVEITGRVQGVFYRNWAKGRAVGLGLSGWVRNADDGHVEMLLQGETDKVDEMIKACRDGSRFAKVKDIRVEDVPVDSGIEGFSILG